jgi:hypothetical protein
VHEATFLSRFHSRTVLSLDPVYSRLVVAQMAIDKIPSVCPFIILMHVASGVSRFHSRTVLSLDPVYSRLVAVQMAIEVISSVCPCMTLEHVASGSSRFYSLMANPVLVYSLFVLIHYSIVFRFLSLFVSICFYSFVIVSYLKICPSLYPIYFMFEFSVFKIHLMTPFWYV